MANQVLKPTKKLIKNFPQTNVVENIRDIGTTTFKVAKDEIVRPLITDIGNQVFGRFERKIFSGEIQPGENLEFNKVLSGQRGQEENLQKKIAFEKRLLEEERELFVRKSESLKIQLNAIMSEIQAIAQTTPSLHEEVKIATMIAPINPGPYHLIFFEAMLEFIKNFRKNIQDAALWLTATNKRAAKMNYWDRYKKYKGKFLLSGEHYSQRSQG